HYEGVVSWRQVHRGLPQIPRPGLASGRDPGSFPFQSTVGRNLDVHEGATTTSDGPSTDRYSTGAKNLIARWLQDDRIQRNGADRNPGGHVARIVGIDLSLNPIRSTLEVIRRWVPSQNDPAQPFDASCSNPSGHYGTKRKPVNRRQRSSVQSRGQQHVFAQSLVEVDRASESEHASLTIHPVQTDELDVTSAVADPNQVQDFT